MPGADRAGRPAGPPVVHVTARYPPALGGMEKAAAALAAQRALRGLPVSVLTSCEPVRGRPAGPGPGPGGPPVRRLRGREIAHTPVLPGLPAALLTAPRGSVVHLHLAQAFVPETVLAAHLLRGLPYIAHLHLEVGPSGPAGFLLRAWKPLVLGPVLRSAAAVAVLHDEQRARVISRYRVPGGRVFVIPNGADAAFRHDAPRVLHHPPRLLFAGRLAVQKNLPVLLRALAGAPGRFDVTLAGTGELDVALRREAAGLGLRDVRFLGRADGADLRALYRDADVFVLPSQREGMPLALLDALAMGLPVVGSDVAGIRALVRDGGNGLLVPPGDPAALRAALLAITADAGRHQAMSRASRQLAGRFSWAAAAARFEPLYAAAAAGARRS